MEDEKEKQKLMNVTGIEWRGRKDRQVQGSKTTLGLNVVLDQFLVLGWNLILSCNRLKLQKTRIVMLMNSMLMEVTL